MLTVKTSIRPSKVSGLGLFADEKISKGTSIWVFNPKWDLLFEQEEVNNMPKHQKEFINTYAYLSPLFEKYVLCIDNSRFMNHSAKINNLDTILFPGEPDTRAVANRDIESGEELLINYRTFDIHDAESKEEYLDN